MTMTVFMNKMCTPRPKRTYHDSIALHHEGSHVGVYVVCSMVHRDQTGSLTDRRIVLVSLLGEMPYSHAGVIRTGGGEYDALVPCLPICE
jgi:hypothetical protein